MTLCYFLFRPCWELAQRHQQEITFAPMELSVLFMGSNLFNPPNQKNLSSDNVHKTLRNQPSP
jgi:hypothetical protein